MLGIALAIPVTGLLMLVNEERSVAPIPPIPATERPIANMRTNTIESLFARGIQRWGFFVSSAAWAIDSIPMKEDMAKVTATRKFWSGMLVRPDTRSEEHTSELQSQSNLVCRLLLEKKKKRVLPWSVLAAPATAVRR